MRRTGLTHHKAKQSRIMQCDMAMPCNTSGNAVALLFLFIFESQQKRPRLKNLTLQEKESWHNHKDETRK